MDSLLLPERVRNTFNIAGPSADIFLFRASMTIVDQSSLHDNAILVQRLQTRVKIQGPESAWMVKVLVSGVARNISSQSSEGSERMGETMVLC
jgi:hypothetical protein